MEIVLRILQSVFAIYGAVYLITSIMSPSWFLSNLSVNEADRRNNGFIRSRTNINLWFKGAFALIGLALLIYAATYPIISAVPFSWGSHDDVGEWQSARDYIRMMATFIATFGLVSQIEKNAESLIWSKIESRSRSALLDALTNTGLSSEELVQSAKSKIEKYLEPAELSSDEWESEAQIRHRDYIINILDQCVRSKKIPLVPNDRR